METDEQRAHAERRFEPSAHFMKVQGGRDYLPVAMRLVWFRQQHPEGTVESEMIEHRRDERGRAMAVFKATVRFVVLVGDEPIEVACTGWGSETSNDFADYLEKGECIRDDAEILTRRGFRHHTAVEVGEDVLAYDVEADRTRWTPLLRKVTYQAVPVVRMTSRDFEAVVTPEHTWATAGTYQSRVSGLSPRRLRETQRLMTSDRLVLAAPAEEGACALTADEAALLGWLVTDGTIWRADGALRPVIYQSKPATVATIRGLVGAVAREAVGAPTRRTFPSGRAYDCLPQHTFHLPAGLVRGLLERAGVAGYADLPALIPRLSAAARRAMLEAMMEADGDERGRFGKIAKPGVQDAWQMLCTLEGLAVGPIRNAARFPVQRMKRRRYASVQGMRIEPAGVADVWCPTTAFGTWVTRLPNGQVTITGNTKAIGRALAHAGYGTQFAEEIADPIVVRQQRQQQQRQQQRPPAQRPPAATTRPAAGRSEPRPPAPPVQASGPVQGESDAASALAAATEENTRAAGPAPLPKGWVAEAMALPDDAQISDDMLTWILKNHDRCGVSIHGLYVLLRETFGEHTPHGEVWPNRLKDALEHLSAGQARQVIALLRERYKMQPKQRQQAGDD